MKSLRDVETRHPGFSERTPVLPPWPPVEPGEPEPFPPRYSTSPAETSFVLALVVCALFAFLMVFSFSITQEAAAEHLLESVATAAASYREDRGTAPPGDGRGSAELVRALRSPRPDGRPYLELRPDQLNAQGDIVRGDAVLRYASNGRDFTLRLRLWDERTLRVER